MGNVLPLASMLCSANTAPCCARQALSLKLSQASQADRRTNTSLLIVMGQREQGFLEGAWALEQQDLGLNSSGTAGTSAVRSLALEQVA